MMWLVLLLVIALLAGVVAWCASEAPPPPLDPAEATKAAVELHRIRRNLDVAWTRSGQRADAARVRREIGKALEEDGTP